MKVYRLTLATICLAATYSSATAALAAKPARAVRVARAAEPAAAAAAAVAAVAEAGAPAGARCETTADCIGPEDLLFCDTNLQNTCEPCIDYCDGSRGQKFQCKEYCPKRYMIVYEGFVLLTPAPPPTLPTSSPATPAPDSYDPADLPPGKDDDRPGDAGIHGRLVESASLTRNNDTKTFTNNKDSIAITAAVAVVGFLAVVGLTFLVRTCLRRRAKYNLKKTAPIQLLFEGVTKYDNSGDNSGKPVGNNDKYNNKAVEAQNRMRQQDVWRCPHSQLVTSTAGSSSRPASLHSQELIPIYGSRSLPDSSRIDIEDVQNWKGETSANNTATVQKKYVSLSRLQSMPPTQ